MNAKDFLNQAYLLDQQIKSKSEQIQSLNELATSCTATMTGIPHNPNRGTSRMADAICKIIDENSNKGKDTYIGEVGSKLTNKYPDFDVRNYGCTKLSTLLEDKMNNFILQKKNTSTIIMIKSTDITREDIEQQIIRILREHNGQCNNMAIINEGLKAWNSAFSAKKLGYSKFSDYLQSFPELLEVKNNEVRLLIK